VVYQYYPGKRMQITAYNDALKICRDKTRWLLAIDLDEFVFCPNTTVEVGCFSKKLREFEAFDQVTFGWLIFGHQGYKTTPDGLIIENYKQRMPYDFSRATKSIIKPQKAIAMWPHIHKMGKDNLSVSADKKLVSRKHHLLDSNSTAELVSLQHVDIGSVPSDNVRINHYYIKSREHLIKKLEKSGASDATVQLRSRKVGEYLYISSNSKIFDDGMSMWIEPVKKAIENRRAHTAILAIDMALPDHHQHIDDRLAV
jgi:hypothetical protein